MVSSIVATSNKHPKGPSDTLTKIPQTRYTRYEYMTKLYYDYQYIYNVNSNIIVIVVYNAALIIMKPPLYGLAISNVQII